MLPKLSLLLFAVLMAFGRPSWAAETEAKGAVICTACENDLGTTMMAGKIDAVAEELENNMAEIQALKEQMKTDILDMEQAQEEIGLSADDSNGKLTGISQLIELARRARIEADKERTLDAYKRASSEIRELAFEVLTIVNSK